MVLSETLKHTALTAIRAFTQANGFPPDRLMLLDLPRGNMAVCPHSEWKTKTDELFPFGIVTDDTGRLYVVGAISHERAAGDTIIL